MVQQQSVELLIVARDAGSPSLSADVNMTVRITQTVNEYPRWVRDYSSDPPIRIPESVPVNFEVSSPCYCYCCTCVCSVLFCFDAVRWAAGRASGLQKTEWWGAGVVICLEQGAADATSTHCRLLR